MRFFIFAYDFNLNAFDFLFNIVISLGIMLNSIANYTNHISTACFSFIISYLKPLILIIAMLPILMHFWGKEAFKAFCMGIGALASGATLYGAVNRGPLDRIEEQIKKANERWDELEARQSAEREALFNRCKEDILKTLADSKAQEAAEAVAQSSSK